MSSEDFWENDPQLYWAYRTFYLKKIEQQQQEKMECIKFESWLKGNMNYVAVSIALDNAFNKDSNKVFPKYNELFKNENKNKDEKIDINILVQEEYNAWARY